LYCADGSLLPVQPLCLLGPTDFFGEIALFAMNPVRTATVRTVGACELFELTRADLDAILPQYPEMAARLDEVCAAMPCNAYRLLMARHGMAWHVPNVNVVHAGRR
jgi:CRP-like cAMP-binding protein